MTDSMKRFASLAFLVIATMGLPLSAVDFGCSWQLKDPVTGEWRAPTPAEEVLFAQQTADAAKAAVKGTPLAAAIPWIDAVARIGALFAAWRIIPKSNVTPLTVSPGRPGEGPLCPLPTAANTVQPKAGAPTPTV
jgi:hypothetical protein